METIDRLSLGRHTAGGTADTAAHPVNSPMGLLPAEEPLHGFGGSSQVSRTGVVGRKSLPQEQPGRFGCLPVWLTAASLWNFAKEENATAATDLCSDEE